MAKQFQAPTLPFDPKQQTRAIEQAFLELATELGELRKQLAAPPKTRALDASGTTILPAVGDTLRLKPPAAGTKVTLPASNAANKGQLITVILEGTLGSVVVSAIEGLVQGVASVTLTGLGRTEFQSDGGDGQAIGGWWSIGPGGGASTWEEVLDAGNSAGAFNPFIPAGQFIGWGVEGSLPATGKIRSSDDFLIRSALDLSLDADRIMFTANGVLRLTITNNGEWNLAGDVGAAGEVPTSQGVGLPVIWAPAGGAGATPALVSSDHILTADFTLGANEGAIIPRYHQINAGIRLTLSAGSTFSIN